MSRKQLADAFNLLAEAAVKVAIELEASDQPEAGASVPPSRSAPASGAGGPERPSAPVDTSVCPKHGTPFTPSKNPGWAAFCSQVTDDPAWGKPKTDRDGNPVLYCRITDRNAGEWLRVHGIAA